MRKTMKQDSPKYESENANKVKNELKFNVDEQQDAINDKDDIEPPWKENAVCVTCNQL